MNLGISVFILAHNPTKVKRNQNRTNLRFVDESIMVLS